MVTENHTFIHSGGDRVEGKEEMTEAWYGFFSEYSDYKNIFEHAITRDDTVNL